jgi:prenylcysteine oxidase / farnesylcysteine lyase
MIFSTLDWNFTEFIFLNMSIHCFKICCSLRKDTVRIDWPAYPHYKAPEKFAPFLLDQRHLYYINTFESAASCIETSAVAAENVARLVISRLLQSSPEHYIKPLPNSEEYLHTDL